MIIRAKFKLGSIENHDWGGRVFKFDAEYDPSIPEDQRFALATPSGSMEIQVDNPEAIKELNLGRRFYLHLIPIDEAGNNDGGDAGAGQ